MNKLGFYESVHTVTCLSLFKTSPNWLALPAFSQAFQLLRSLHHCTLSLTLILLFFTPSLSCLLAFSAFSKFMHFLLPPPPPPNPQHTEKFWPPWPSWPGHNPCYAFSQNQKCAAGPAVAHSTPPPVSLSLRLRRDTQPRLERSQARAGGRGEHQPPAGSASDYNEPDGLE